MEILNKDLTDASNLSISTDDLYQITGEGIFDDLMESVNKHLTAQFKLGRITGSDYAQVYLAAMQAAMQNANQFILGRQRADAEAEYLRAQMKTQYVTTMKMLAEVKKQFGYDKAEIIDVTDDDGIVIGYSYDLHEDTAANNGLIDKQILKTTEEVALVTAQELKVSAEKSLLVQKEVTELAQTSGSITLNAEGEYAGGDGVTGYQMNLFNEQAKGFYWNAQNKHVKAYFDGQAVNANIADVADTDTFCHLNSKMTLMYGEPRKSGHDPSDHIINTCV